METLIPSAHFLRVSDKFFAEYICYDPAVSSHARFLYVLLSRHSARGICGLPQQLLARLCDLSVRSIQHHLKRLSALQYINIEQQSDGRNAYRLLLSPRARHYIALAEADLATWADSAESASAHAKNLRIGGEKSAPSYKKKKEKNNTPLSPLPAAHPCKTASSCRPFLAAAGHPLPAESGRGDSFPTPRENSPASSAAAAFERLFAAWPVKKDKAMAQRIFLSLASARKLPMLDELLCIVERFKAHDRHWRNGCVPLLSTWLRCRRWQDEPYETSTSAQAFGGPAPATPLAPKKAEDLRRCLQRLEAQRRPDPKLEAARPLFEALLGRFVDGQTKRGPAWGLWSALFRRGKAPTVAQLSQNITTGILPFLQSWQRGVYAAA